MDVFDSIALWGRRFDRQTTASGSTRFTLRDLLLAFDQNAIHELTPVVEGRSLPTVRPDPVRKVKVSLLDDGVSAIHSSSGEWFEVYRTAPSGDIAKARIEAFSPAGAKVGEIRMLVGRRTFDQYFAEDPIFAHIERAGV
jgi:hypothetical protein